MTDADYSRKLDELDVPIQPDRIWSLLADVSRPELTAGDQRQPRRRPPRSAR